MTLIKGLRSNPSQIKHSLRRGLDDGVPHELGITTVQKKDQKKLKSKKAEDAYEDFNWPRRIIN